jgi:hypothetical protein
LFQYWTKIPIVALSLSKFKKGFIYKSIAGIIIFIAA